MAKRKTPYLGKAHGCQLLAAWLEQKDREQEGSRAFYERGMQNSPHLMPCPQQKGWWLYREACDHCPYGVRKP